MTCRNELISALPCGRAGHCCFFLTVVASHADVIEWAYRYIEPRYCNVCVISQNQTPILLYCGHLCGMCAQYVSKHRAVVGPWEVWSQSRESTVSTRQTGQDTTTVSLSQARAIKRPYQGCHFNIEPTNNSVFASTSTLKDYTEQHVPSGGVMGKAPEGWKQHSLCSICIDTFALSNALSMLKPTFNIK